MIQRQEIPIRTADYAWLTNIPLVWSPHNFNKMNDDAAEMFLAFVAACCVPTLHFCLVSLDAERIRDHYLKGVGANRGSFIPSDEMLSEASDGEYAE